MKTPLTVALAAALALSACSSSAPNTDEAFCSAVVSWNAAMSQIGADLSALGEVMSGASDPADPAAVTAMHAAATDLLALAEQADTQAATAVASTKDADVITAIEAMNGVTLEVARFMGEAARDAGDLEDLAGEIYANTELFQDLADLDTASYGAVLAAYGNATCASQLTGDDPQSSDNAAKADATLLGEYIATYWIDWEDGDAAPVIALSGETYTLNGTAIGDRSENVTVTDQWATGPTAWCVEVTNPSGAAKTYNYSAFGGLGAGPCLAP